MWDFLVIILSFSKNVFLYIVVLWVCFAAYKNRKMDVKEANDYGTKWNLIFTSIYLVLYLVSSLSMLLELEYDLSLSVGLSFIIVGALFFILTVIYQVALIVSRAIESR